MGTDVSIFKSNSPAYSDDWEKSDEYPEKRILESLSGLLNKESLFKGIIKPGDNIVIKPNWVIDFHELGYDIFSVITHSSLIRAIVDMAYKELKGEGSIIIADAPQSNCNFNKLISKTKIEKIQEYYADHYNFHIPVVDLRQNCVLNTSDGSFIKTENRIDLPGDPSGYVPVNLEGKSAFTGLKNCERIYGADYNRKETIKHHNSDRHEYLVSKTVLDADLLISVPKLKVHKKVGATLNAKGMVGINGDKNWIAHFRIGSPSEGGDEFSDREESISKSKAMMRRRLMDALLASGNAFTEKIYSVIDSSYKNYIKPLLGRKNTRPLSVTSGNWYGNDTAWRMCADLARVAIHADKKGEIRKEPQRKFFSVVDGIIGGEKDGPLAPSPKNSGVVIAGENLLAVDIVCARLMGFDWKKIRYLKWMVDNCPDEFDLNNGKNDIRIHSNVNEWTELLKNKSISDLCFEPHSGWKGHLEINRWI